MSSGELHHDLFRSAVCAFILSQQFERVRVRLFINNAALLLLRAPFFVAVFDRSRYVYVRRTPDSFVLKLRAFYSTHCIASLPPCERTQSSVNRAVATCTCNGLDWALNSTLPARY